MKKSVLLLFCFLLTGTLLCSVVRLSIGAPFNKRESTKIPQTTAEPSSAFAPASFLGYKEIIADNSHLFNFSFPPPMSNDEHIMLVRKGHDAIVRQLKELLETKVPQSASGNIRRPAAVFTIVRNEPVFIRAWIAHYRHTFLDGDIYVLDNNMGRDGSLEEFRGGHDRRASGESSEILQEFLSQPKEGRTSGSGINIIDAECDAYYNDHNCLRGSVSLTAGLLLLGYKTVIFSEVDELLFSVNPQVSLWQYLCDFNKPAIKVDTRTPIETRSSNSTILSSANATQNFTQTSVSPPFNWISKNQLATQRELWFRDDLYRKPLIFQRPLRWRNGFHTARFGPPLRFDSTGKVIVEIDYLGSKQPKRKKNKKYDEVTEVTDEIILLHIHRIDKDYFTHRGSWKSSQVQRDPISPQARFNGSRLEAYYWGDFGEYDRAEPIPPWWKTVEERHLLSYATGVCSSIERVDISV